MEQKITTFLMFEGRAEEAMQFYLSLFPDSKIVSDKRYPPSESHPQGQIKHAVFELNGQLFMCTDSPVRHAFTFTPSMSLYVACADENEIARLYEALSLDGQIMMPLDAYPFSQRFAWLQDRFGVSWQLNVME